MSERHIGYGEDIHRLVKGDHLTLCGVKIPFSETALAHSDGDCAYHAVADALLGSAALGDIGFYFPPSDSSTKGIDSSIIVAKAVSLLNEKGFRLVNLDLTIILEEPRLAPYREAMRSNLARLLGIALDSVSVKAGTNEGLDAVGRGEAVKAIALVSVEK